ncbi:hypothetical protein ACIQBJ_32135 [Kitasatospora sp. NPDC088391]|uniref:hypothetical protein n=1 Tax=Kitasatospora sp. NPDC088391 TaxID=3364074 RepID=UPI00381CAA8F
MAIVSRKESDLSGESGTDAEFASVVVRQHPSIDQPKSLDVLVSELDSFKDIGGDLVILEVRTPNGETRDVYMKVPDFNKLAPDMPKVLKEARGTRGRVPGTRVGNGNG